MQSSTVLEFLKPSKVCDLKCGGGRVVGAPSGRVWLFVAAWATALLLGGGPI